jgi:hypothetical protein
MPLHKVWQLQPIFQTLMLAWQHFINNSYTKFQENLTNSLDTDTRSWKDEEKPVYTVSILTAKRK